MCGYGGNRACQRGHTANPELIGCWYHVDFGAPCAGVGCPYNHNAPNALREAASIPPPPQEVAPEADGEADAEMETTEEQPPPRQRND